MSNKNKSKFNLRCRCTLSLKTICGNVESLELTKTISYPRKFSDLLTIKNMTHFTFLNSKSG